MSDEQPRDPGIDPSLIEELRTDWDRKSFIIKKVIGSDNNDDFVEFLREKFKLSLDDAKRLTCDYGAGYGPMLLDFCDELRHSPSSQDRKETLERIAVELSLVDAFRRKLDEAFAEVDARIRLSAGKPQADDLNSCLEIFKQQLTVKAFAKSLAALPDLDLRWCDWIMVDLKVPSVFLDGKEKVVNDAQAAFLFALTQARRGDWVTFSSLQDTFSILYGTNQNRLFKDVRKRFPALVESSHRGYRLIPR